MANVTSEDSYKLWQLNTNRSWESLYNLLYNDYYEGHKLGLDNELVYKIMQIAQTFDGKDANFPESSDDFYETLNQELKRY